MTFGFILALWRLFFFVGFVCGSGGRRFVYTGWQAHDSRGMKASRQPVWRHCRELHLYARKTESSWGKLKYMTSNKIQFLCLFSLEGKPNLLYPLSSLPNHSRKKKTVTFSSLFFEFITSPIQAFGLSAATRDEAKKGFSLLSRVSSEPIKKLSQNPEN